MLHNVIHFLPEPSEVHSIVVHPKLFSVLLMWSVPKQTNGIIIHYTIQYYVNEMSRIFNTTNNITRYSITGLNSSTLVSYITISATTGAGEGPVTNVRNITTLDRPGK